MKRALPLLAILALVALAAPAGAMMIKVPINDLSRQAGSILRGRVVATHSAWTSDKSTIVTEVTIAVNEAWKGRAPSGDTLTLVVPGGEVGELGVYTEHAPAFENNEDVVLFLDSDAGGAYHVSADEQGKFTIVGDWIVGYEHLPVKLADFRTEVGRYAPAEGR